MSESLVVSLGFFSAARMICCGKRRHREGQSGVKDREREGGETNEHRGDSSSASNHADVLGKAGSVAHLTLGALDIDKVSDLELREVTRDVAGGVALREKVKRFNSASNGWGKK